MIGSSTTRLAAVRIGRRDDHVSKGSSAALSPSIVDLVGGVRTRTRRAPTSTSTSSTSILFGPRVGGSRVSRIAVGRK